MINFRQGIIQAKMRLKGTLRIAVILGLLAIPAASKAGSRYEFRHNPPIVRAYDDFERGMKISLSERGISRARVLVATPLGYRAHSMVLAGDEYSTYVKFDKNPLIRYQFQVETNGGEVYRSEFYNLREPSETTLTEYAQQLKEDLKVLGARERQLESKVHSVKVSNPADLVQQKDAEKARALVSVSRAESEYKKLVLELNSEQAQLKEQLLDYNGKYAIKAKALLRPADGFFDDDSSEEVN